MMDSRRRAMFSSSAHVAAHIGYSVRGWEFRSFPVARHVTKVAESAHRASKAN